MTDPQIRAAAPADAAALAAVYRSAYRRNRELGFPAKAGSATREEVAAWIREHRVFVAEVAPEPAADGRPVVDSGPGAAVVGGVRLEATAPDRLKLSRLGVHADWKGDGIGSELLAHAEAVARDDGYAAIWLTTPEEHPFLPDLYRARGYEKTGEYPLAYREYDEIVLEKRL